MLAGLDASVADDVHHAADFLRHHLSLNPRPDTGWSDAVVERFPPERVRCDTEVDRSGPDHMSHPLTEPPHIHPVFASVWAECLTILAGQRSYRPLAI